MATRVVEGKKPYTGGKAISIDENKVISLNLRDENNLIIYDAGDDEIYVDLQLDDEITPTDAFPIGVNVGRVIVDNGWDKPGTIISAETTSGDNIKIFYADEGTLWIDNGTGTFKQIYFKSDVDALLLALRNYIDGELAKKQNGVSSDTAPSNPSEGDLWYDTTNSAMKVWGGTAWQNATGGAEIEYKTQAEYNALPSSKLTDGKHYFIYSTSGGGGWQPGANTLAYWKFDGNLNSAFTGGATLSGTPYGYATGIDGQALQNTNNVQLDSSLTQGDIYSGAFTIAFCVNMQNSSSIQRIFVYGGGPSGSVDIQYEFYNDFSGFQVYTNGLSQRIAFPLANPGIGVWKNIVVTGDGVNQIECYIDGVKINAYSDYNTTFTYPSQNTAFSIRGGDGTNNLLDGVIIENKHWTQTDVDAYISAYPVS